jgi:hypothetical protein
LDQIDESRWRPILNLLIETLEKHAPDCREKRMTRFYLEELFYRFWHYKLGAECTCTDIDFVEYKAGEEPEILALFEIKTPLSSTLRPGVPTQRRVEIQIARKLGVPLWLVTYDKDLKTFEVKRLDQDEPPKTLTEQEYIDFHRKKLRGIAEPPDMLHEYFFSSEH